MKLVMFSESWGGMTATGHVGSVEQAQERCAYNFASGRVLDARGRVVVRLYRDQIVADYRCPGCDEVDGRARRPDDFSDLCELCREAERARACEG